MVRWVLLILWGVSQADPFGAELEADERVEEG